MGNLTNKQVQNTYDGLIKLADETSGVKATLQPLQDGLGNNLPIQVSSTEVVITGSFSGDGSNLTGITTTTAVSASHAIFAESALSASYAENVDLPSDIISGSVQISDLGFATTSSVTSLSSSVAVTDLAQDGRLSSLETESGSIRGDFNTFTSSQASVDSVQDGRLGALETETGSLQSQINSKLDSSSFNTYSGDTLNQINTKLDSSSFNTFTSSQAGVDSTQDGRLGSLETESGSMRGDFNSFTSSQSGVDTAQDNRLDSLETETGSLQSEINTKLNTSSFNTFTSSQAGVDSTQDGRLNSLEENTGSYATTGSNVFVGVQQINNDLIIQGNLFVSGSEIILSSSTLIIGDREIELNANRTVGNSGIIVYDVVFPEGTGSLQYDVTENYWIAGQFGSEERIITSDITSSMSVQSSVSSSHSIFAESSLSSSHSANSDNSISSSFAQNAISSSHSVNSDTAISSSFATNSDTAVSSSFAQNAISSSHSVNSDTAISSSHSINSDTAISSSHSVNSDTAISSSHSVNSDTAISSSHSINSDTAISSSHSINSDNSISASHAIFAESAPMPDVSFFATTGSNIFQGNQNITGALLQSSSLPNEFTRVQIATSNKAFFGGPNTLLSLVGDTQGVVDFYMDGGNYDTLNINLVQNSGSVFRDWDGNNYNNWLKIPTNTGNNPAPQFQRGLVITGSVNISGNTISVGSMTQNFTAPATNQEVSFINVSNAAIAGKAYNRVFFGMADYPSFGQVYEDFFSIEYFDSTAYNFGSEITVNGKQSKLFTRASGSNNTSVIQTIDNYNGTTFAKVTSTNKVEILSPQIRIGRAQGSQILIEGSVQQWVSGITISSATASVDFSKSNFQTLTLASGVATHITPINMSPGQSVVVEITQDGTSAGTVTFDSSTTFAGGTPYAPTTTLGGKDVLTLVTFNGTVARGAGQNEFS